MCLSINTSYVATKSPETNPGEGENAANGNSDEPSVTGNEEKVPYPDLKASRPCTCGKRKLLAKKCFNFCHIECHFDVPVCLMIVSTSNKI